MSKHWFNFWKKKIYIYIIICTNSTQRSKITHNYQGLKSIKGYKTRFSTRKGDDVTIKVRYSRLISQNVNKIGWFWLHLYIFTILFLSSMERREKRGENEN